MKRLSSNELRQMFLDFFESKGHQVVPPASLIPVDDPTLLWINSGVATLKSYFDGSEKPDNNRLTNSQKSIRTNDIENVGYTARHHTLFEMLGNFSIGDYFKEEAIVWAWELLTSDEWYGIEPEKLSVTVYPEDEEAKRIWHEVVGLPKDRIIDLEENFWDIGAGPSGPNTEIFYDRGQEYNDLAEDDPESFPGGENERWLEIWNIVFSQFNHLPDDTYEPLPNKNIDTGMGLERLASVSQDAPTNFETDLFLPIIQEVERLSGVEYEGNETLKPSFKIIADHVRAVAFSIGDGALPSNEGRGYIIRRLIRRSVVHAHRLGIDGPFLSQLVPIIGEIMGGFYPELVERQDFIQEVIHREEVRFHETLSDGMSILGNLMEDLEAEGKNVVGGKEAFKLYDTYGFPLELTEEFAQDKNMTVDTEGFEEEMTQQRERARQARSTEQSMSVQSDLFNDFTATSDFIGYDENETTAKLIYIISDDQVVAQAEPDTTVELIFDETPFYAEKGGQIADTGVIIDASGHTVADVFNVQQAPGGQNLHYAEVYQALELGQTYHLVINENRRSLIRKNHTATHLLHQALKDVLGEHVNQAGSLVAPDLLRFDFSHLSPMTSEELEQVEHIVNEKIWQNIVIETVETDINTAKEMGAMALFGEKYGEEVRVVTASDYSKELCGGTHVSNTGEIGIFKITQETGIGAGIRRIFAQTSLGAYEWYENQLSILDEIQQQSKAQTVEDLPARISSYQSKIKSLQSEIESLQSKLANDEAEEAFSQVNEANGVSYIAITVDVSDMNQLRDLADQWKQNDYSDVLVLGLRQGEKANLLAAMKPNMIEQGFKAGDLIKEIATHINGGGGGRPDMAQAGGSHPEGLEKAYKAVANWLETH